jgi:hypothetical protein
VHDDDDEFNNNDDHDDVYDNHDDNAVNLYKCYDTKEHEIEIDDTI